MKILPAGVVPPILFHADAGGDSSDRAKDIFSTLADTYRI